MKKESFPFDRTLRDLIKRLPLKLIEILTDSEVLEILNSNFPSVEERKADFVARLKDNNIIHIEIQTQNDTNLPERLIDYFIRIKNTYGRFPTQIILWIGEGKVPYREENILGNITFKCTVIDIKQIDCSVLLESDDPNDNILAVLCKRNEGFWKKLSERLMKLPIRKRQSYMKKLFYLVRLREDIFEDYETLKKEVSDMPLVIDIKKDPLYKRGHVKGLQQGMEKGMEKGIVKGLILEAQELVIEALVVKFNDIDNKLKKQITTINNRDTLKMLHRLAIQAQSLDEFKKKMKALI